MRTTQYGLSGAVNASPIIHNSSSGHVGTDILSTIAWCAEFCCEDVFLGTRMPPGLGLSSSFDGSVRLGSVVFTDRWELRADVPVIPVGEQAVVAVCVLEEFPLHELGVIDGP